MYKNVTFCRVGILCTLSVTLTVLPCVIFLTYEQVLAIAGNSVACLEW